MIFKCNRFFSTGKDLIGLAETGSGKTGAFAIPILQALLDNPQRLFALVLTPTRELAFQISEQFEALGASMGVKSGEYVRMAFIVLGTWHVKKVWHYRKFRPCLWSCLTHFDFPPSALRLGNQRPWYVQPCLSDWAYTRSHATYWKEKGIVSLWSVSS